MASHVYPKALEQFLQAGINLAGVNIKAVMIDDADYVYSDAHVFLSEVAAAARVATSGNLANKNYTNGVFDADDIAISAVTGDTCEAVIIYVDTGVAGTSRLLAYLEAVAPFTPNGSDVLLQFSASGIFSI